eukprot:4967055-Pleurochrysis_carterae.AAC.1
MPHASHPITTDDGAGMFCTMIILLAPASSVSTACVTALPVRSRASSEAESVIVGGPSSYLVSLPRW